VFSSRASHTLLRRHQPGRCCSRTSARSSPHVRRHPRFLLLKPVDKPVLLSARHLLPWGLRGAPVFSDRCRRQACAARWRPACVRPWSVAQQHPYPLQLCRAERATSNSGSEGLKRPRVAAAPPSVQASTPVNDLSRACARFSPLSCRGFPSQPCCLSRFSAWLGSSGCSPPSRARFCLLAAASSGSRLRFNTRHSS